MTRNVRIAAVMLGLAMLLGVATAGASLAQSTPSAAASGSGAKKTFIYADTSEPSSLNPIKGYLGTDYTIWAMNYDLPFNFSTADFSPEPALVMSVDTSSDGMHFTYHLRQGVKWSDGQPFTANDFAWTLNFYKTNNVPNYGGDLKLMDTAKVTDPNTVLITTTQPTSFFSGKSTYMYEYILPEHIWGKFENDYAGAKEQTNVPSVGTGPYIIKSYTTGQSVVLERNPYYWGPRPNYDEIIYRIFNNEDAEAQSLRSGEIQFALIDSANILNSLADSPNIATRGAEVPAFDEVAMNTGSAYYPKTSTYTPHGDGARALTDRNVRRAIRMAIDSKTLVDKVLLGYGTPGTSIAPNTSITGAHWQPSGSDYLGFNIQAANQLLDQSGYKDTDGDGVRNDPKTGENLVFRYFTRNSDQNTIKTAPFVKDWLSQIGIQLDIQSVSSGKLATIINQGNYDMFDWGWLPNPDPDSILSDFTCDQRPPDGKAYGNDDPYYCNPAYDKLVFQQKSELDPTKRLEEMRQAQKIFYEDAPYAVKWYSATLEAYRTDMVTGFKPQPAGSAGDLLATFGPLSFISIRPAAGSTGAEAAKGVPAVVWIGIVIAILVVIAAIVLMRRRGTSVSDEDRA
jgi:peptide/nickel transport system substrate-binding protein